MIEFLTNNALASSLVAAAVLGLVAWGWRARHECIDKKATYNFLASSKSEGKFTFRSTAAIASNTRLSEERVIELFSKHTKIRRNEKEKQSWTLVEDDASTP